MLDVILKRFESPDETREFEKGKFELVHIGGMTIGRASYEPGWKWSEHVSPVAGTEFCEVEHVGMVLSGRATAAMKDGKVVELTPGTLFYVPPGRMTAGALEMNLTFRSTSWVQIVTRLIRSEAKGV